MITVKTISETKPNETKEYLERQQNIDALLVLSKFLEVNVSPAILEKAQLKISQLIDKV